MLASDGTGIVSIKHMVTVVFCSGYKRTLNLLQPHGGHEILLKGPMLKTLVVDIQCTSFRIMSEAPARSQLA